MFRCTCSGIPCRKASTCSLRNCVKILLQTIYVRLKTELVNLLPQRCVLPALSIATLNFTPLFTHQNNHQHNTPASNILRPATSAHHHYSEPLGVTPHPWHFPPFVLLGWSKRPHRKERGRLFIWESIAPMPHKIEAKTTLELFETFSLNWRKRMGPLLSAWLCVANTIDFTARNVASFSTARGLFDLIRCEIYLFVRWSAYYNEYYALLNNCLKFPCYRRCSYRRAQSYVCRVRFDLAFTRDFFLLFFPFEMEKKANNLALPHLRSRTNFPPRYEVQWACRTFRGAHVFVFRQWSQAPFPFRMIQSWSLAKKYSSITFSGPCPALKAAVADRPKWPEGQHWATCENNDLARCRPYLRVELYAARAILLSLGYNCTVVI